MIRGDLSRAVAEYLGHQGSRVSVRSVDAILLAALDVITDQLKQGERVELRGFGVFLTKRRATRNFPNPMRRGARVTVAAHVAPRFKPSARLRAAVNPE